MLGICKETPRVLAVRRENPQVKNVIRPKG